MDIFDEIRGAFGIDSHEPIEFVTPVLDRLDGRECEAIPKNKQQISALLTAPKWVQDYVCLGYWDAGKDWIHYLFPHEWMQVIPEGAPVLTATNRIIYFNKSESSGEDRRFGCLSFGVLVGNAEAWRSDQIKEIKRCPGMRINPKAAHFLQHISDIKNIKLNAHQNYWCVPKENIRSSDAKTQ